MSEPGKELMVSPAGLTEAEAEQYLVKTGPLEVSRGPGGDGWGEAVDWVMVGMPSPGGGVRLFASKTLTRAGLQRRVEGYALVPITARPDGPVARVPVETRTVIAVMKDFTLINAETYPEALRSLMEMWDRARPES